MDIGELEAGLELDSLIAHEVMGMEDGDALTMVHSGASLEAWSPSTDIRDAFAVLKKLMVNYEYEIGYEIPRDESDKPHCSGRPHHYCMLIPKERDGISIDSWPLGDADSVELAICRAALQAVK